MTDGLEISEKKYSEISENKDGRIDSQFWTTDLTQNTKYTYVKISKILKQSQYGISIEMNEDGKGYPIYRMNEIHNSVCDLDVKKYADITPQEFEIFKLNNGDVLFNRTNSYEWVGRTGIYYRASEHDEKIFASYLVRLIPDTQNVLPEYLTAFLNTQNGICQIKARARQSVNQTNVNPEEVKEIEIPLLSRELQTAIQRNYLLAFADLTASQHAYAQAEELLNNYLGVPYIDERSCAVKSLSQSFMQSGRLDAEYYQPKYDLLFELLGKFTAINLGGEKGLVAIKKSIEPGSEAYKEEGIPFVRVSDVNKFGISETAIKLSPSIVSDIASLYPKKDTILLSKDGSVGIAYKMQENMQAVTSGALLHLTIKDTSKILPDYLTLVLNSQIVQLQAERDCNGAIIQHWKPSDIENVRIPVLDMDKQKEISDKVQESFRLRKEAKQLLDNAIKAVEMAIETDEETALLWLES